MLFPDAKSLFKIAKGIMNTEYDEFDSFDVADYSTKIEMVQPDEYFSYIIFSANGKVQTIIKKNESFINYLGIISALINAIFSLMKILIFIFYDKAMMIDVIETFYLRANDKILKKINTEHIFSPIPTKKLRSKNPSQKINNLNKNISQSKIISLIDDKNDQIIDNKNKIHNSIFKSIINSIKPTIPQTLANIYANVSTYSARAATPPFSTPGAAS